MTTLASTSEFNIEIEVRLLISLAKERISQLKLTEEQLTSKASLLPQSTTKSAFEV